MHTDNAGLSGFRVTGAGGFLGGRIAAWLGRDQLAQTAGAGVVIHTATCYGRRGESAEEIHRANVQWPLEIIASMPEGSTFVNTDTTLLAEVSEYARSKAAFRIEGRAAAEARGVRWINLRLEHFYGPGESEDKFVTRMIRACLNGGEVELTEGSQLRDFVYVDDVVRAFSVALQAGQPELHVASGAPVSIRSLVERIHGMCGSKATLKFGAVPSRASEVVEVDCPSIANYGWRPEVSLEEGLERMVKFVSNTCVS